MIDTYEADVIGGESVKEFFEKLSTYDLFVNFIPGCVFVGYLQYYIGISVVPNEGNGSTLMMVVTCYIVGFCISRIGALVVEPISRKTGWVKFAPYQLFLDAKRKDSEINQLSEVNNFYRSLVSLAGVVGISETIIRLDSIMSFANSNCVLILAAVFFVVFLLSYKSQTRYVVKRVEEALKNKSEETSDSDE